MKRLFDISASLIGLILSGPIIITFMIAIRISSEGPALFRQERVGRDEVPFVCLKLRTMNVGTPVNATHLVSANSVTPIGIFLRRTKLDELPQLWNVLIGEMSFVGPRPCLPIQDELITKRRDAEIFSLVPGITGLAQIRGIDMSDPSRLVECECEYSKDRSFLYDLGLIISTLKGDGREDRVGE